MQLLPNKEPKYLHAQALTIVLYPQGIKEIQYWKRRIMSYDFRTHDFAIYNVKHPIQVAFYWGALPWQHTMKPPTWMLRSPADRTLKWYLNAVLPNFDMKIEKRRIKGNVWDWHLFHKKKWIPFKKGMVSIKYKGVI